MQYAIGIDIGGTNIKVVCVSPDGKVIQQHSYASEDSTDGNAKWLTRVPQIVEQIQQSQDGEAVWVGVTSPGVARPDGTSIAWMVGRMEQVVDLNWTEHLNWPRFVPVLNDAHAALLGEVWQGAAIGAKDAVLLTLGTGVGGAVLANGQLLKGHTGRAGHLGHISLNPNGSPDICGTPGSLEDAIGNCTIEQRTAGRFKTTTALVEAHQNGDADASRIWLNSVHALAAAIASLINSIDPQFVILGGGIAEAGDHLFQPLEHFLDHMEWRPTGNKVTIVPAKLGAFAGALGAAYHAITSSTATHSSFPSRREST